MPTIQPPTITSPAVSQTSQASGLSSSVTLDDIIGILTYLSLRNIFIF